MDNKRAIVLGGSMAGLLAARVLSDHFERVSIVERDRFPNDAATRKGVPQAKHAHALLAKGYEILLHLFPDLDEDLRVHGALIGDPATITRWYQDGQYSRYTHSGLIGSFQSRALLEHLIRQRVLAIPNVKAYQQTDVLSLVANADGSHVTGVLLRPPVRASRNGTVPLAEPAHGVIGAGSPEVQLDGDLIVDATGRGSQLPKWLRELGYAEPREANIKVNFGYATRIYRRTDALTNADGLFVAPTPPQTRGGGIFPIEGDRWMVTLAGFLADYPPTDEQGFLAFARSLSVPDLYDAIKDAVPLSEIAQYKYPSSRRRYYETLERFPEGLIAVGDAISSFNPVYGQGMSVAALEAMTLNDALCDQRHGFPLRFFRTVSKVVDVPWALAAGADLNYPQVEGQRARGTRLINWYLKRLGRVSQEDETVYRAFVRVVQLMQPPSLLFSPMIAARVLFGKSPRANATPMQAIKHSQQV